MKKVGIITVHCADNYGSVLQTLALQEAVKKLNYKCGVIPYCPKQICGDYRVLWTVEEIKKAAPYGAVAVLRSVIWIRIKKFPQFLHRKIKFMQFRNKFFTYVKDKSADTLICGSDQLWNPDITKGFDKNYFLSFAEEQQRCISYAVSMGKEYSETEKQCIKPLLQNLDAISVRESSDLYVVRELYRGNVVKACDPVLLFTKQFWKKFEKKSKVNTDEDYIFYYTLQPEQYQIEFVNKLSKKTSCKMVHFFYGRLERRLEGEKETFYFEGPQEFLYLIHHAKYVVTDSYHGTVLSLIYKKQFYSFKPVKKGGRLEDVLNEVGLSNRLFSKTNEIKILENISSQEFAEADKKINQMRELSRAYLKNNI